jgi:hypothetical protein
MSSKATACYHMWAVSPSAPANPSFYTSQLRSCELSLCFKSYPFCNITRHARGRLIYRDRSFATNRLVRWVNSIAAGTVSPSVE